MESGASFAVDYYRFDGREGLFHHGGGRSLPPHRLGAPARVRRRLVPRGHEKTPATAPLLGLHVGALIYLGTFATANNFDYRLAAKTLLSIVILLWVGSLSERLHLWDELASWIVAGQLTALVAVTLPRLSSVRHIVMGDRAVTRVDP